MALKIYNSLSNELEKFSPINEDSVSFYSCGPTVYNFAHIGNFRAFIFADTVKRTLSYLGYNVKHIMNFTDVEDKIIRAHGKIMSANPEPKAWIELNHTTLNIIRSNYSEVQPEIERVHKLSLRSLNKKLYLEISDGYLEILEIQPKAIRITQITNVKINKFHNL